MRLLSLTAVFGLSLVIGGCGDKDSIDVDDTGDTTGSDDGGSDDGGSDDGGSDDGGSDDGGSDDGGSDDGGSDDGGGDDGGGDDGGSGEPEAIEVTKLSTRLHDIESMVYVSWTQSADATSHIEYSFDEGEWLSTPSVEYAEGVVERVLVGIPYETEAEWRLVVEDSDTVIGETFEGGTVTTGELPSGLPIGTLEVADEKNWYSGGSYLLTSINENTGGWRGGTYWTFIVDRKGRVVWAHDAPDNHWTLFAQVSVTGDHFLWDEATYWSDWDEGEDSHVHRRYLDAEIESIHTPGLHHAFIEMPDGTLVWGSQAHGNGETLAKKGPDDAEETLIWNCREDWPNVSSCESNGLFYSTERDTFLYSFYTNSSIVEVDHKTGESLWWAGTVRDGYEFDPLDSQFSWQHGISYTEEGTLLISTESSAFGGRGITTMVREYEVDHKNGVLTDIWNFDSEERADTNGAAWRLPNDNLLHIIGSSGHIKEATYEGEVVWHMDFHGTHLLGDGEFIDDLYDLVKPAE